MHSMDTEKRHAFRFTLYLPFLNHLDSKMCLCIYICNFCVINLIIFLEMFQRDDQFTYKQQEADWARETRGKKLIQTIHLGNWVLLHTQRDSNIANDFKQTLQRVCGPMGMNVSEPVMYVFLISLSGGVWHMQNVNSGCGMT